MSLEPAPEIGGYVLAGGQSSRMGRDKAEVPLAGRPLVQHAVAKLRRVCAEVSVLGSRPALAAYAPLIPDVHPGCGPLGGMEAALLQTRFAWNLTLPVDVPFLPTTLLLAWTREILPLAAAHGARVLLFEVEGRPQPTLALLHREVQPFLTAALERGDFKLLPALAEAGRSLAVQGGFAPEAGLWRKPIEEVGSALAASSLEGQGGGSTPVVMEASEVARWFANLNTPEDLREAERHGAALDT